MSTGIVHQPDTPVSSGSPASLGGGPGGGVEDVKEGKEEEVDSNCSPEQLVNGDHHRDGDESSRSPSPGSLTPNLSFITTPPTNGILTPPNDNDLVQGGEQSLKSDNHSGRLKFYKDGILCLELSHHDEGEKRKWVQIRTKTVFPNIVHTKKEVSIPRHVSPSPNFHHNQNHSHRALDHSSASHSTSDDGSSMLSSPPRVRESSWRKPVPRKGISNLELFYFRPAPCAKRLRVVAAAKLCRQPYNNGPAIQIQSTSTTTCKCNCDTVPEANSASEGTDAAVDSDSKSKSGRSTRRKPHPPLDTILEKLKAEAEIRFKQLEIMANQRTPPDLVLPKKRPFRDSSGCGSSSPSRPKNSSPSKRSVKTILNIPGFGNGNDVVSRRILGASASEDSTPPKKERRSPHSSSSSPKKPHPQSHSPNSYLNISSLAPEQQQLFQKQTMSKAISYTINSLLSPQNHTHQDGPKKGEESPSKPYFGGGGSGSRSGGVDQNSFLRHLLDTSDPIPKNQTPPEVSKKPKHHTHPPVGGSSSGSGSRLPHPPKKSATPPSHTHKSNHHSHHSSQEKDRYYSPPPPQPQPPPPQPQLQPHPQAHPLGAFLHPSAMFHPSLLSSSFPLHQLQLYESLLGRGNPAVGAFAAAAAEMQYHQAMAAATPPGGGGAAAAAAAMAAMGMSPSMMAQYLGGGSGFGQQHPPQTSSPSPRSENSSPSKHRDRSSGSGGRRESNGGCAPTPTIPVPFHAPLRDNPHSMMRPSSSSSSSSSRSDHTHRTSGSGRVERLVKVLDNDDVPLNLSKK